MQEEKVMKKKSLLLKIFLLNSTIMCPFTMGSPQILDGLVYYEGDRLTAHQERYTMVAGLRIEQPHGDLPEHKGHEVHYAEAFLKNQAPVLLTRQREHAGGYRHDGLLKDNFHPTIRSQHLIYSDGANIYQPHVTQELWTRAHGTPQQEEVSFIISSHNERLRLNWIPGVHIETETGDLPVGLYQFISAKNLTEQVPHDQNNVVGVQTNYIRREKWKNIGTEKLFYIRAPAHHLVSVPGIPEYVINDFPSEPKDFVDLKTIIDTYEETVRDNVDLPRPEQRIIFIGDARVGKDALAHYYAGSNLTVNFNRAFRPARIELQGAPPLGTLGVVSGIIGSRAAGSWFDQRGQRVIWTTPGANGVEAPLNDILNVLSLKTLLTRNNPSKYVLTIKESDLFEENYKNLKEVLKRVSHMFGYHKRDDGTVVVGRTDDLKRALSLVVSRAKDLTKDDLVDGIYVDDNGVQQPVKGLLRNILETMQTSPEIFDAGGMALLEYLVDHPERISFFSVPIAGEALYRPGNPLNSLESIQQSIDVTDGNVSRYMTIQAPSDMHLVFKTESERFIQDVLNKLNDQVTRYLSKDAVQKIWGLCNQQILGHEGTVDALRDKLRVFSDKFRNSRAQPLDSFVADVETLLSINGITRNINHIRYLHEKLGINITYARDQWLAPLAAVMSNIHYISSKDRVDGSANFDPLKGINYFFDSQTQELTLVGYLIGVTDVENFIEDNLTKKGISGINSGVQVRKLNLFSLRNFLIDGNLKINEATVVGIAPEILQTVQSVMFDLSGRAHTALSKAADDTAGIPGMHGRNGGSLVLFSNNFKDVYKTVHPQDITKFEIKRDGSSGQDGQKGGKSTKVPEAVEGNTGGWYESGSHSVSAGRGTWDAEKDRYHVSELKCHGGSDDDAKGHHGGHYQHHLSIDYVWKEYKEKGIKGTKGTTGKDGGVKGLNGFEGLIDVYCPNINYAVISTPPQGGADGKGGKGSSGGLGGQFNYQVTYTYQPGRYDHNGEDFWANAESGTTVLGGGRYRETAAVLLAHERGPSGDDGDRGVKGANTTGQATQSPQLTAGQLQATRDRQIQLYSTRYYTLAADPIKQKLLGKFTGLPSQ